MALFNATGWLLKGGGKGGATMSAMDDGDPYSSEKTRVHLVLSNVKLKITDRRTRFVLSFSVVEPGFTIDKANVPFRLELKSDGSWRYTSVIDTANLEKQSQSIDISNQVNGSGQLKALLTNKNNGNVDSQGNGKCYLLFETSTEICDNQIRCEIQTS